MKKKKKMESKAVSVLSEDIKKDIHVRGNRANPVLIAVLIVILLIVICFLLGTGIVSKGTQAARETFENSKDEASNNAYDKFYQDSYDYAEAKSHVSNRVTISIDSIKEESILEVLRVNDVYYSIVEDENGKKRIKWAPDFIKGEVTTWIEIPGDGVFTVNLKAAEFIVDNERQYVLIRLPKPELSEISIDYKNVSLMHIEEEGMLQIDDGEAIAREQLQSAEIAMHQNIIGTQQFYQSAQDATRQMLTNLVKELNPEMNNLHVEIEFMQ